jgi:two-component system, NtrC family, response regulator AtoC
MPELRQEVHQLPAFIGESSQAKEMRKFAAKVSGNFATVLLTGETGTGKDQLAELTHSLGQPQAPFVRVDCTSIPEHMLETELFGHTRGAFTDARQEKEGLMQVAENGTLFLNEVAEMPLSLQAKFLKVLEKKSFRKLGGTLEIKVRTRIIAATNVDLESALRQGKIRPDLYYRMNVISYTVPPLRERKGDVPLLAQYFLREEGSRHELSLEAMELMEGYHWPGNIRELKNAVTRATFHSDDGVIRERHLRPYMDKPVASLPDPASAPIPTLQDAEKEYLKRVLSCTNGNVVKATKIAGISRATINYRIKIYGLSEFVQKLREF